MESRDNPKPLSIIGGHFGALLPFLVFMSGAIWLGLEGNADVYAYWPVVSLALLLGLILARDRTRYAEAIIDGMSQHMVMIMVSAWLFASVIGALLYATGFVEALVWLADKGAISGRLFTVFAFITAAVIGTSTGTSAGTILTCTPILYPAGYLLGAEPAVLVGAIIGGGAFGDNLSPISDTTIASALTQETDIGGVVRSRLKYALSAAGLAAVLYFITGSGDASQGGGDLLGDFADPRGLPMVIVPIVIIWLCVRRRHLIEALFWGIIVGIVAGLLLGLISFHDLYNLNPERDKAGGVFLDGLHGGVGISVMTILLMGVVAIIRESGTMEGLIAFFSKLIKNARQADIWIALTTIFTNILLVHNTVTIITLGEFSRRIGSLFHIHPYRRANVLDVSANTVQHILPFMTTVIIGSAATEYGVKYGAPLLSPLKVGLLNFHSWMLLAVIIFAAVSGFGQKFMADGEKS
ncbi:Na+/H+ antiporter NhaC family protein [candidate division KSB1 bacterium]